MHSARMLFKRIVYWRCRWISVLNNAKEAVLMKAFGESSDKESSPINQNMKELARAVIEQVQLLPGNDRCCDCGAPGWKQLFA